MDYDDYENGVYSFDIHLTYLKISAWASPSVDASIHDVDTSISLGMPRMLGRDATILSQSSRRSRKATQASRALRK